MSVEQAAPVVLTRFPAARDGAAASLGNHGGFSGARLWRITSPGGPLCLRAWPAVVVAPRLAAVHRAQLTARRAGLAFVPGVHLTDDGATWVEHGGRLWELTDWLPGHADFHEHPSVPRLEAACVALARLHAAWADAAAMDICPGVRRRRDSAAAWAALVRSGWRPLEHCQADDPVRPWAERAWAQVQRHIGAVPALLEPWLRRRVALQPCLCDPWHDHVLFTGDAVTGLLDYGSVKVDHVAVDLARLLGSLVGDEPAWRQAGLAAYARVRPLAAEERRLVEVLDRSGTVLGASHWLRWLFHEGRVFEGRAAVVRRLGELVGRMEAW